MTVAKSTSKLFTEENPKPMSDKDMNLPESAEQEVKEELPAPAKKKEEKKDDIQDIDLSVMARTRFRINGDNNKIIELNISDLGIVPRLNKAYGKLNELMDEVGDALQSLPDKEEDVTEEVFNSMSDTLENLDKEMKKQVDYLFDAPVSEKCCDGGSMWDPIDGSFRYEHIIEKLANLYTNNLSAEFSKMKRKVEDRTAKYTKAKTATSKYHR